MVRNKVRLVAKGFSEDLGGRHPMFILLVSEDPLSADDVLIFRRSFKDPNFIAGEVVQLFLHGSHPIRVLKRFLYASGFNTRNKRVKFENEACLERVLTPLEGLPMI